MCIKTPKIILFSIFTLIFAINAEAASRLRFSHSFAYFSATDDDSTDGETTILSNRFLIGVALDSKKKWILGHSFYFWSKTKSVGSDSSQDHELTLAEYGPYVTFYFTSMLTSYLTLGFNYLTTGDRKIGNGSSETITGTGYWVSVGYLARISKKWRVGVGITYNVASIAESKVATTETDVTDSYSTIIPTLRWSYRFN